MSDHGSGVPPSLKDVVALVLQADPVLLDEESGVDTLPTWDSMQQVVLVSVIEQTYGVTFGPDEITSENTVARLRAALRRKGVGVA